MMLNGARTRLSISQIFLLTAMSGSFASTVVAQSIPFSQERVDVPVMSGGRSPAMNACGGIGFVEGLDPRGDGFLSVRSGPGGKQFREIARLHNGQQVFVCDIVAPWLGVVYATNVRQDCGLSTSGPRRLPYTGPCGYGWIHSRYVGAAATPPSATPTRSTVLPLITKEWASDSDELMKMARMPPNFAGDFVFHVWSCSEHGCDKAAVLNRSTGEIIDLPFFLGTTDYGATDDGKGQHLTASQDGTVTIWWSIRSKRHVEVWKFHGRGFDRIR